MAGRISLSIIIVAMMILFGYALHREQSRRQELPFRVIRVVDETDHEAVTIDGMNAPFTVLLYEGPHIQRTVPGVIGRLGEVIWMAPPEHP